MSYDIGAGFLGNGITVWNRLELTSYGDYKSIAHINNNKKITYFQQLPFEVKEKIKSLIN